MRRADRLFRIVQYLSGGRLVTASRLAERLEVSMRTVYRDIADLQASGVPIDGAAGVGYILRHGFDLPPLMFTRDEIVALVAGARMVRAWGGLEMARAAEEALIKIETVLPDGARDSLRRVQIHAFGRAMTDSVRAALDLIEQAADTRHILSFAYIDADGTETTRTIRPLGLWFWGGRWTCVGWCELRHDFRMFRIDRMSGVAETGEVFRAEPGRTLKDFYAMMERHGAPGGMAPADSRSG